MLVARKPAVLHHLRGKQNYQALFLYWSELGEYLCHFLRYFTHNFAVFYSTVLQKRLHSFNIQDDRSTGVCIEKSPLDGTFQSAHCAVMRWCRPLNNRLWAKLWKKSFFKYNFQNHLWIFAMLSPNLQCEPSIWMNTSRKRSQNHFRLHFSYLETPYSLDTRGILSTPECDVLVLLKITTGKAIRKRSWQTFKIRKQHNSIWWNI